MNACRSDEMSMAFPAALKETHMPREGGLLFDS